MRLDPFERLLLPLNRNPELAQAKQAATTAAHLAELQLRHRGVTVEAVRVGD